LVGQATIDTPLNGAATFLDGLAYTNSDRDPATATATATATALYGITRGNLYQVTNPNGGTVALVGALGTGATGDSFTGFDVSSSGTAFASLYLTGAASSFTRSTSRPERQRWSEISAIPLAASSISPLPPRRTR
jgi:hypothetical protein